MPPGEAFSEFRDQGVAGNLAVNLVLWVILLAGILKCLQIAKRPTTNTVCVLSLVLSLLAWTLTIGLGASGGELGVDPAVKRVVSLVIVAATLACPVLGIVGLVQVRRSRGRYVQGRAQAVAGLLLGSIHLALLTVGIIRAETRDSGRAPREVRLAEYNLHLQPPAGGWVARPLVTKGGRATLQFDQTSPEVSVLVLGEAPGVESGCDLAGVVRSDSAAQDRNPGFALRSKESLHSNGIPGVLCDFDSQTDGRTAAVASWVGVRNGFVYRVVAMGARTDRRRVREACAAFRAALRPLDPSRVAHVPGTVPLDEVRCPGFGFTVRFSCPGWCRADELASSLPFGAVRARCGEHLMLVVVPVEVGSDVPAPDASALISAFLSLTAFPGKDPVVSDVRQGIASGHQIRHESPVGGERMHFLLRILRQGRFAYLLYAVGTGDPGAAPGALERVLDSVEFHGVPDGVPAVVPGWEPRDARAPVFESLGDEAAGKQSFAAAAAYYLQALAARPGDESLLLRTVFSLSAVGRYAEALALLDVHRLSLGGRPAVRASRAVLLARTGETDAAIGAYEALLRDGSFDEDHLDDFVRLLLDTDRAARGIEVLRRCAETRDSARVRFNLALLLMRSGNTEEAAGVLEGLHERDPKNLEVTQLLAEALANLGRYQQALDLLLVIIEDGEAVAKTLVLRARCEEGLGWLDRARASYEAALRLAPGNGEIEARIRLLSGLLGEGDTSGAMVEIAPVPLPPEALREIEAAIAPGGTRPGAGGVRALRTIVVVEFRAGTPLKSTCYRTLVIEDDTGIDLAKQLVWPYDPLRERIWVSRLEVIGPDGTVMAADTRDFHVTVDSESGETSHGRVLSTPVPGLRVGCRIECVVTREDLAPLPRFPFLRHVLAANVPVSVGAFVLRGDVERLHWASTGDLRCGAASGARWWIASDSPAVVWETLQPPDTAHLPSVLVGDREATWEGVAREYLGGLADRLEAPAEIQSLRDRILADARDEDGKIRAIARHVQAAVKFQGLGFGPRRSVPDPADLTIQRGWGDCKGQALLLLLLLRSAGIPAHLALAHTSEPVRPDFPCIGQFDHMIVYLPDRGLFLDPTEKDTDVMSPVPPCLFDRDALVLDPDRPRLVRIPTLPPDSGTMRFERQVRLEFDAGGAATGRVLIEDRQTMPGLLCSQLKADLRQASDRDAVLRQIFSVWGAELTREATTRHLDEPERAFVLEVACSVPEVFRPAGDLLVGALPLLLERWVLDLPGLPKRIAPIHIPFPIVIDGEVELAVPRGYRLRQLPSSGQEERPPFADWRWAWEERAGSVRVTWWFRLRAGRFEASRYAELCRALQGAQAPLRTTLVLERER